MANSIFSDKTRDLSGSAIRATFKLLADPEIISFAGGAPSPDVFPKKELEEMYEMYGIGGGDDNDIQ